MSASISAVGEPSTVASVVLAAAAAPDANATKCSGPCCCTWCGGIIIQFAAFGFLSVSSAVAWPVGMLFAYAYAFGILVLVKHLEEKQVSLLFELA